MDEQYKLYMIIDNPASAYGFGTVEKRWWFPTAKEAIDFYDKYVRDVVYGHMNPYHKNNGTKIRQAEITGPKTEEGTKYYKSLVLNYQHTSH